MLQPGLGYEQSGASPPLTVLIQCNMIVWKRHSGWGHPFLGCSRQGSSHGRDGPLGLISPAQALAECTLPRGTPHHHQHPEWGHHWLLRTSFPSIPKLRLTRLPRPREIRPVSRASGLLEIVRYQCLVSSLNCVQFFCDPIDCSPPGSSVHGISQTGILEWVAISFCR